MKAQSSTSTPSSALIQQTTRVSPLKPCRGDPMHPSPPYPTKLLPRTILFACRMTNPNAPIHQEQAIVQAIHIEGNGTELDPVGASGFRECIRRFRDTATSPADRHGKFPVKIWTGIKHFALHTSRQRRQEYHARQHGIVSGTIPHEEQTRGRSRAAFRLAAVLIEHRFLVFTAQTGSL